MNKKDSSSWSEIKSLDERLARDPASFCFARLSETYLKIGLVADALHTARQGVAKHPGYLAGQRALAMACNANGLHGESRSILEQVTSAMPEDTVAQKLLASLYVEAGDKGSAIRAYTTLLDFSPDDVQSKAQLEELQQVDSGEPLQVMTPSEPVVYDEKIVEEAEEEVYELSEADIVHDEEKASEIDMEPAAAPAAEVTSQEHHDPLSTLTLAELYEQQGFVGKALDIYRTILADDPANAQLQTKIALLDSQVLTAQQMTDHPAATDPDGEQEPIVAAASGDVSTPLRSLFIAPPVPEGATTFEPEPVAPAAFEDMPAPVEAQGFSPLAHNQADNVVGTLDSWLENIRRIKACR